MIRSFFNLLLIMMAGGLGTGIRFLCSTWIVQQMRLPFFLGTFSVNLVGCFFIGALSQWIDPKELLFGVSLKTQVILIGLLGGFTTFSSFSLETVRLFQQGSYFVAIGYIVGSLCFCLGGTVLGIYLEILLKGLK